MIADIDAQIRYASVFRVGEASDPWNWLAGPLQEIEADAVH